MRMRAPWLLLLCVYVSAAAAFGTIRVEPHALKALSRGALANRSQLDSLIPPKTLSELARRHPALGEVWRDPSLAARYRNQLDDAALELHNRSGQSYALLLARSAGHPIAPIDMAELALVLQAEHTGRLHGGGADPDTPGQPTLSSQMLELQRNLAAVPGDAATRSAGARRALRFYQQTPDSADSGPLADFPVFKPALSPAEAKSALVGVPVSAPRQLKPATAWTAPVPVPVPAPAAPVLPEPLPTPAFGHPLTLAERLEALRADPQPNRGWSPCGSQPDDDETWLEWRMRCRSRAPPDELLRWREQLIGATPPAAQVRP